MYKQAYSVDAKDALVALLAGSIGGVGGYGLYKFMVPEEKRTLGKALGFTLGGGLGLGGLGFGVSNYASNKIESGYDAAKKEIANKLEAADQRLNKKDPGNS